MGVDAAASDRLPWLTDEVPPARTGKRRRGALFAAAAAALSLTAAGGFWIGLRSVEHRDVARATHGLATTTVRLPPARPATEPEVRIALGRDVRMASPPDVRPIPSREVRIAPPVRRRSPTLVVGSSDQPKKAFAVQPSRDLGKSVGGQVPATAPSQAAVIQPFVMPPPWNPRVIAGAAGRLVQVGAFGSITQAKHGWWFMVRAYPAMSHLPAVVRATQNSRGRQFYRFQVGTTSQAHSEVLCQRMRKIALSCAVVGLPWKARVER